MKRLGFTLLELSVVLAILAVIMASGLTLLTVSVQQAQYDDTVNKIAVIEKALSDYSMAFTRLPCPSSLTALPSTTAYGAEVSSPGNCSGANYTSSGIAEGGIPTRTLQLDESYLYDGWGRRLRYAVDTSYTNNTGSNAGLPPPVGGIGIPSASGITVYGFNGAIRTTSAVYVIVSHGANGHGAYTKTGGQFNGASKNTEEFTNCHCDGSIVNNSTLAYVQHAPNNSSPGNSGNTAYRFDDIVAFKLAWQLPTRLFSSPSSYLPNYLFVADYNNNKFWQYNISSQSWKGTSVPNMSGAQAIAVDSSGNIYFGNAGNSYILKYTSSTQTWATWSATGLSQPTGISFDSSGHVYVANYGGTVNEYNASGGSYIKQWTGFTAPQTVFIDASGNMWVADSGTNCTTNNKCIQKYNGSAWTTIGSYGTNPGQFYNPSGIYIDAHNVLWIADTTNNRVQKCSLGTNCNVSANWTVYGGTASGSATGQFYQPGSIWGDALGNIWVPDGYNRRIQVYSAATQQWSIFANMMPVTNTSTTTPHYFSYGLCAAGR